VRIGNLVGITHPVLNSLFLLGDPFWNLAEMNMDDFHIVTEIRWNDVGTVLEFRDPPERSGDPTIWVKVLVNGRVGWCSKRYLEVVG
jgi:hypothetical protein